MQSAETRRRRTRRINGGRKTRRRRQETGRRETDILDDGRRQSTDVEELSGEPASRGNGLGRQVTGVVADEPRSGGRRRTRRNRRVEVGYNRNDMHFTRRQAENLTGTTPGTKPSEAGTVAELERPSMSRMSSHRKRRRPGKRRLKADGRPWTSVGNGKRRTSTSIYATSNPTRLSRTTVRRRELSSTVEADDGGGRGRYA